MLSFSTLALALCQLSSAHFVLNYPASLGFSDDNEGNAPCGGFDVKFQDNDTNVPVGEFAIAMFSSHPQAQWLFRATLDKQAPFNWTNILPVVEETGPGDFCLPSLSLPADFAGKQGVIQVMQDAADGLLYQCAAVNFIQGTNTTVGPDCKNATGLSATISNQNAFASSAASGSASATASMTMSMSGSATSKAAAASSSSAASGSVALPGSLFAMVLALPVGLLFG